MVLLSDDIFSIDPAKIRDVKVLKTMVGGKVVWDQDRKKQYSTAN
jgi:predicted amidohydrolase YtcJ